MDDLIAYAFQFSDRSNRKLKIIYVFDFDWMRQSFMIGSAAPLDPSMVVVEKNAREEFKKAETKIRETAGEFIKKHSVNVPFEIHISEINRIDTVQEEFEKEAGLILLISNHQSYSEASGGMIGYPNLVEHVRCPVFVIPEPVKYSVVKKVVYATNYHPEDIESLKHLKGLLKDVPDIDFTILHNQIDHDFGEQLKWIGFQELVKQQTGIEEPEFIMGAEKDMVDAIEAYDKKNNPDLLVVLKEERGFFQELFRSSETKSVLTHFHKPVLVYHEKQKIKI